MFKMKSQNLKVSTITCSEYSWSCLTSEVTCQCKADTHITEVMSTIPSNKKQTKNKPDLKTKQNGHIEPKSNYYFFLIFQTLESNNNLAITWNHSWVTTFDHINCIRSIFQITYLKSSWSIPNPYMPHLSYVIIQMKYVL